MKHISYGLKMNKIISVFMVNALVISMLSMTGCGKSFFGNSIESSTESEVHFDTVMTITLYGKDKLQLEDCIVKSFEEVDVLENIFSAQAKDSELYHINEAIAQGETAFQVSDEIEEVLSCAMDVNEKSDGALDVTIGNLINLWGIGTDHARVPQDEEIQSALEGTGCKYLSLDTDTNTLTVTSDKVQLNLGAIAKGYAADRIENLILSINPEIVGILDFGGNIITIGSKVDGSNWNVGITDPLDSSNVYGGLSVSDLSIVTSGNYERFFEVDGVKYPHIIDPETGYPVENGLASVTVESDDSALADALTTALFVMGYDKAVEFWRSGTYDFEMALIDENGKLYLTEGLKDQVKSYVQTEIITR